MIALPFGLYAQTAVSFTEDVDSPCRFSVSMMRLYAHYAALSRVTASTAARPMSDPWYDTSDYVYPEGDMWGFKRIDAAYAWALSNGDGVTVAVLDSGIDMLQIGRAHV